MAKYNCCNLNVFMEKFLHLEQRITEINAKNNMLESRLEDANKRLQFYMTREKSLVEERAGLLVSVSRLQQTLQEQFHLRVENRRLKTDMADLTQQHEKTVESKDAELKKLLEMKDLALQEMKERLNKQEKERQSELLQLQLEFGAKLARVQSSSQHHHQQEDCDHHRHQQQQQQQQEDRDHHHHHQQQQQQQRQQHSPHGSGLLPLTVFKRKLHFFQEEKNREIVALRQRITELEENQRGCSRLRKRRM